MWVQQIWSLTALDRIKVFQWSHLREYARTSLSTVLRNMCTCSPVECIHFSILLVHWCPLQGICFKIDYLSAFSNNFNCVFLDDYFFLYNYKTNFCLIVFCKNERWTCIYIDLKEVSVFLESASRVYEFIWKELSISVTNTAEGRSWSRIIEIVRSQSRMAGLPTPQAWPRDRIFDWWHNSYSQNRHYLNWYKNLKHLYRRGVSYLLYYIWPAGQMQIKPTKPFHSAW